MSWAPCTTCVHADHDSAPDGRAYCTRPEGPFIYLAIPEGEGCTKHVRRCYSCEAEAVNWGDVPRCDNCAEAAWERQQTEAQ